MRLGDVARKLRMPLSNLSAVASGRRSVSLGLLSRIARILGCTIPELFEETGTGQPSAFKSDPLGRAVRQIEEANPLGIEKGWTHRLALAWERHFKAVREAGASYGSDPRRESRDPYTTLIERFNKAGVDYVVIGMAGINYYASSAMETFGTRDYDVFLRPAVTNATAALKILHELGYKTATTVGVVSEKNLKQAIFQKKTILAANPDGVTFELLFAVSGFAFGQMAADASIFKTGEALVRVAKLNKLLASKEAANRPKDRFFLKRYKMILRELPQKSMSKS
jgi:transcriptional regulator with XRE-family HTH domain